MVKKKLNTEATKKRSQNSLFTALKDGFQLTINHIQKTAVDVFSTPSGGKNQISKDLEKFEKTLIEKRKI
ncbi:hypothetical protein [Candidatus Absconditicoccus praedator]|uniref:hypothetical protein n=1 Tax=Candidatus Absconditicoccus praedator TaxID=2735562 RepID=UPI001E3CD1CC|nr:hypothetical protein [Candidatus Absconditicoccus praedator]UFX82666.1 hypothetical protein HLG78_00750 [Candidatus Absconditicoccus praedator]